MKPNSKKMLLIGSVVLVGLLLIGGIIALVLYFAVFKKSSPECKTSNDCDPGEACIDGKCVAGASCKTDDDCKSKPNQKCDKTSGKCICAIYTSKDGSCYSADQLIQAMKTKGYIENQDGLKCSVANGIVKCAEGIFINDKDKGINNVSCDSETTEATSSEQWSKCVADIPTCSSCGGMNFPGANNSADSDYYKKPDVVDGSLAWRNECKNGWLSCAKDSEAWWSISKIGQPF